MKNNTKIRLHLSKNLFESIAKEVLAEAKKVNDGYSVAVKQPKAPKQSKDQSTSPEVQKTDKEAKMEEMETRVAEEGTIDEYVGVEPTEGLITALASLLGIGVPLATALYKDLKGKSKEEKKKVLQNISAHMDKTVGGNEPGQGHGVKTGKF